jgi:hypothetical protein
LDTKLKSSRRYQLKQELTIKTSKPIDLAVTKLCPKEAQWRLIAIRQINREFAK